GGRVNRRSRARPRPSPRSLTVPAPGGPTAVGNDGRMTPRTLVFSLFGDFLRYCGRGEVPLSGLSRLLELFDVEPGTTRVAMTRLRKDGWFTSERNGREVTYLLADRGWELLDEGRERIFGPRGEDWARSWS